MSDITVALPYIATTFVAASGPTSNEVVVVDSLEAKYPPKAGLDKSI